MNVFKFKKYKNEYKDGKRGATLRYPLEVEPFFASQGMGGALAHGFPATETGLLRVLYLVMLLSRRLVSPHMVLRPLGPQIAVPLKGRIFQLPPPSPQSRAK